MHRMKNPSHPGDFLKHEIVEAHELSTADAAKALGVSRQALHRLLNGEAALTADMALRFEKAFGVDMETLLRMQTSYDVVQTRQRAGAIKVQPFKPAEPRAPQPELAV